MKKSVYFDYAATTPLDDEVFAAMLPYFQNEFGNPSSIHMYGQAAEAAIESAREICSQILETKPENVIFTSGGTESDNLAIRGVALLQRKIAGKDEIIISPVEHHAVSRTARQLADVFGFVIKILPVDQFGMIDPSDLAETISKKTAVVSIVYANNEVGTINPVAELGKICRDAEIPFHSDAVQAAAHLPMGLRKDSISLLSIGGHKMYGPKGIGLLAVQSAIEMIPILTGGGQENSLRAGTQNVPLIVGLAEAFRLAQNNCTDHGNNYVSMRNYLINKVLDSIPGAKLTGHPTKRLPNHASFVFESIDGNRLLNILDARGYACSSGSACKVGSPSPSNVLISMGINADIALGSLRITLGRSNNIEQIDQFVPTLMDCISILRKK